MSIHDTNGTPLFELRSVTLRIRDRHVFHDTSWRIETGEHWALLGPNGSGKSTLARVISGETPVVAGKVYKLGRSTVLGNGSVDAVNADGVSGHNGNHRLRVGYVSPELYRRHMSRELDLDHSRFAAGRPDDQCTVREFLMLRPECRRLADLTKIMGIDHLMDRPIRVLSSGEMKRLLLVRTLSDRHHLLILDEPFDGLDTEAMAALVRALDTVRDRGTTIVLITHRREEILPFITRIALIQDCSIHHTGRPDEILGEPANKKEQGSSDGSNSAVAVHPATRRSEERDPDTRDPLLVEFSDVTIRYDGTTVLDRLTWRVAAGEHWCILGPNGSGKTTILNLIYGENLQGYANDIRVFGNPRGDEHTIWWLRRRIGMVTPSLQARYRKRVSAIEVLVSGFFASVGLYTRPTPAQTAAARRTARLLGIESYLDRMFDQLSAGERMLVLIGRALVKEPELLLLDEPCQGLDVRNRGIILDSVEGIIRAGRTLSLLYVTHHADEIPEGITHTLRL